MISDTYILSYWAILQR